MESKPDITICLGSACFARGNNNTRKVIEDYLSENGLGDRVRFHGARCFDHCQNGPVLKIDEQIHEHMGETSVIDLLDRMLQEKGWK